MEDPSEIESSEVPAGGERKGIFEKGDRKEAGPGFAELRKTGEREELVVDPLSAELAKVRDKSQTIQRRIGAMSDAVFGKGIGEAEGISGPTGDVLGEAQQLVEKEAFTVDELTQSQAVAARLQGSIQEASQRRPSLRKARFELRDKLSELDWRRMEPDRAIGLKGLWRPIRNKRLSWEEKRLRAELASTDAQTEALDAKDREYRDRLGSLQYRQAEAFLALAEPDLQAIRGEYVGFAEKVFEDGRLLHEVREAYVNSRISPLIDSSIEQGEVSQEEKEEFLSKLNAYLEKRDASEEEASELREKLDAFFRHPGKFYSVEDPCVVLLEGDERRVIERLATHLAHQDLERIRNEWLELRDTYGWRSQIDKLFDRVSRPLKRYVEGEEVREIWIQPVSGDFLAGYPRRYMPVWAAIKESESAGAIFGDLIQNLDKDIYETVLHKSLEDSEGGYIDSLEYYPTPEAIKTLVLLAAADERNYRTVHANGSLAALASEEGWEAQLEQAEEKHPSLKSVHSILLKWNESPYRDSYGNNPELRKQVGEFALSVLSSGESDPRIIALARESLSSQDVIAGLAREGTVSPEDALALKEALSLTEALSEEHHIGYNFGNILRQYALVASQEGETKEKRRAVKQLEGMVKLANAIKEHEGNLALLEYFSEAAVFLMGKASADRVDLILKAPERCPALLTKVEGLALGGKYLKEILVEYHEQLLSEEGLAFLQSMAEAYAGREKEISLVVTRVVEGALTRERALELPEKIPDLLGGDFELAVEFSQLYLQTDEDIQFFRNMLEAYGNDRAVIRLATNAILKQDLSRELVLKFPERVPGLMSPEMEQARWQVFASLDTLLTGESDFNFLEQLATNYEGSGEDAYQVLLAIVNKGLSRDLALKFPKKAKALMSDEMKPMRRYVFENADTLLHEESDLQFLTRLVGKHGKTADQIVRDYLRCLQEGAIERSEKDLVLEFAEVFRVISPTTLVAYKEAKAAGGGEVFLTGLRDLAEKMISTESVPEKDRETPYYDEILRSVYANNAGNWGSHKLNATCTDRSRDLDQFSFESRYEIDLLSAADVSVREGETLDREKIKELEENVYALAREMEEQGFDSEKAKEALASEVEEKLRTVQERGGLTGVDLEKITSTEERLFLLLVDAVYGEGSIDTADLKRLVIRYEFAYFEDIRDYIEGTNDRVGRARNPDYGLLTELHSFYSDRIKEVNRGLVRAALENPEVAKTFPQYFEQLSKDAAIQKRKEIMSRQRVDRLGMSDSFIEQIRRSLRGKTGRDYTPEYVRRLIARYESSTGGLREKTTVSKKKRTKAFYGQLRAQREKTFRVMQELTGEEVDPQDVHLDEINLAELIEGQVSIEKGRYDEEQFASYTVQRFLNVFADEREAIESQLDKFKTASGKGREVLNAYFTKSKESANARMVGGVCVAGDNPDRSGRKNMWDMENYFQLVFQDPETYRCQGLVLLHHFTDDEGKRILAASLNPSSTYVLSVDEEALFAGIMGLLVEFTEGNEFDMIVTSSNRTIRTNRTGGAFEKAIEERIRKIGKEYRFAEPKRFSFQNQYHLQEMDVVWEKGE